MEVKLFRELAFKLNKKMALSMFDRVMREGKSDTRPAKPDKLLYVAASSLPYHISGYTARTQEILLALKKKNVNFNAVTRCGYPWDRSDRLIKAEQDSTRVEGINYTHWRKPTKYHLLFRYAFASARKLMIFAKNNGITRIHAASNHTNAMPALIAAKKLGLPFQYEIRGLWELSKASRCPGFADSPGYRLGLDFEAYIARNADRIFVISEALGRYLIRNWQIKAEKIRFLPNCVDADRIAPADMAIEKNTIGYAGSLVGYEGLDTLLESLALLRDKGQIYKLRIAGDGEERPRLQKLAKGLRLEGQVQFLGRLNGEDARSMLRGCALVCIPRKPYEVCAIVPPLKLAESMALGKAVIVPDLPVFKDEIGESDSGWFFSSGDPGSLAIAIETAFSNDCILCCKGQAARNHILANRQWHRWIEQLCQR